jgi:hypothetical protein
LWIEYSVAVVIHWLGVARLFLFRMNLVELCEHR